MSQALEDYALIGDTHTAALVGRDGSVDWLCVPRFDSAACFAAILGTPANGRWLIAPKSGGLATRRSYQEGTLVLDQEWDTPSGTVRVTDFMPPRHHRPRVYRRIEGVRGSVEMAGQLVIRFEYGSQVPWVTQTGNGIRAIAGPDLIEVDSPVPQQPVHMHHEMSFVVKEGEQYDFRLHWAPSYDDDGRDLDCATALDETVAFWRDWSRLTTGVSGEWDDLIQRSLLTLKALTYAPTGGIVAAPTTSLPEEIGGPRNWDYRYCWVRDATLTLEGARRVGSPGGGEGVVPVAPAGRGRQPRPAPDHVRGGGGAAAARARARLVAWLPVFPARPGRQRSVVAVPTRRVRRAYGGHRHGPGQGCGDRTGRLGSPTGARRVRGEPLGRA